MYTVIVNRFFSPFGTKLYSWLGKPSFFYIIVALLIVQALWIALTARYPQAFDEHFHVGLIQLHAAQWLPFFTTHVPGAEVYGAISRDPSYFYHYMFSIPYRALSNMSISFEVTIILFRLINIGIFVTGLFVYRKLLSELGLSRRLANVVLFFFVLTPIVPLLAAHINYDNLIFLLTALLLLQSVRYLKSLYATHTYNITSLMWVVLYALLSSIIKYTSLPLSVAVIAILLGASLWAYYRNSRDEQYAFLWPKRLMIFFFILGFLAFTGLAAERYGINMLRYHTPVPDCGQVLTEKECLSYSVWARDHFYAANHSKPAPLGIAVYPFVWVHRMVFETMFTISSRLEPDGVTVTYIPAPPLTVANYTAWGLLLGGVILGFVYCRRLWQLVYMRWLLLAIIFYTVVLFIKNFSMYMHTGEAMAIHGRYLIPVFPILYAALALVFGWGIERFGRPAAKIWLVIVTMLLLVHGGGLIVWIYRSNPSWYWSQNPDAPVYRINKPLQDVIHRVIIP